MSNRSHNHTKTHKQHQIRTVTLKHYTPMTKIYSATIGANAVEPDDLCFIKRARKINNQSGFCKHAENAAPIWGLTCPTEATTIPKQTTQHQIRTVALMQIYIASIGGSAAQLDKLCVIKCASIINKRTCV